jgi:hypothetical protein
VIINYLLRLLFLLLPASDAKDRASELEASAWPKLVNSRYSTKILLFTENNQLSCERKLHVSGIS